MSSAENIVVVAARLVWQERHGTVFFSFHCEKISKFWTLSLSLFCLSCVLACCYSQQRTLMQAACRLFSARISDLMPMTRRLPKQVMKAMTQTDTRSTMLANRSSKEEMPSVLGLQDLT